MKDDIFYGVPFVQELLKRLNEESDTYSKKNGLNPYEWTTSNEEKTEHYWRAMSIIQNILKYSGAKENAKSKGDSRLVSEIESFLSIKPFSFNKSQCG